LYPLEDVAGIAPKSGVREARQSGHVRVACGGQGRNALREEPENTRRMVVSSQRVARARHAAIGTPARRHVRGERWWGFLGCFVRPCYRYVGGAGLGHIRRADLAVDGCDGIGVPRT
jgi:hypothetical protein